MTQPSEGPAATGVPTCYRHPGRETWIRCQRCDRPICPDCMRDAAVGFQCPDCVKEAAKGSRQNRALYGGERSADPRLTSYVLIAINALVWLAITATGGSGSRLTALLALSPRGRCELTDGSVIVELSFAGADWLVREVLKEAGDAAVLEPAEAREAVREAVARLRVVR